MRGEGKGFWGIYGGREDRVSFLNRVYEVYPVLLTSGVRFLFTESGAHIQCADL